MSNDVVKPVTLEDVTRIKQTKIQNTFNNLRLNSLLLTKYENSHIISNQLFYFIIYLPNILRTQQTDKPVYDIIEKKCSK